MPKKTTIEDLAAMIKRGFDQTATKEDMHALEQRTAGLETRLVHVEQKVDDGFQHVNARLDIIRDDVSDLPAMREELQNLRHRLERVEQKVGLTK